MKGHYNHLKSHGAPFDIAASGPYLPTSAADFTRVLKGCRDRNKSNLILQVADLVLFPVTIGKEQPGYPPYVGLQERKLIIDDSLPSVDRRNLGIKYYRFDHLVAVP